MEPLLLQLKGVCRTFCTAEETVSALKNIDLVIARGEMVAFMGPSGSGKSTLMNILGCLDKPTSGSYRIAGRETSTLQPDELAHLRREYFGFIFQRYHLIADLTASDNVEIPAIYSGLHPAARRSRARALLDRLGMIARSEHKPGQLSGGQQQRVSVARALMNGGQVILADEPTGALDTHAGQDMLKLLQELNAQGHTIIIVTHDPHVAVIAERVIEISDGTIVSDRRRAASPALAPPCQQDLPAAFASPLQASIDHYSEAFRMALHALWAHKLRTLLTMLGIVIGVASMVCVIALGKGSQQQILANINSIGTNTIDIFPGKGFGDRDSAKIETLIAADAEVLSNQSFVDSVTPVVSSTKILRYRSQALSVSIIGAGEQYFRVKGYTFSSGRAFGRSEVDSLAQAVVIDDNTRRKLFGNENAALNQIILLGNVPCRVIGILDPIKSNFENTDTLKVFIPYTSALKRLLGQSFLQTITVRISDKTSSSAAEQGIRRLLTRRHGTQDFFIVNTDTIRQTILKTEQTTRVLIAMIALISLVVGGIGVMNIMLVSVTERTSEIGVRMAVGARQADIQRQFMIEAILVCLVGGLFGVMSALGFGIIFPKLSTSFSLVYSADSVWAAFAFASVIGIVFGYVPARNAARLDPVDALSRQ